MCVSCDTNGGQLLRVKHPGARHRSPPWQQVVRGSGFERRAPSLSVAARVMPALASNRNHVRLSASSIELSRRLALATPELEARNGSTSAALRRMETNRTRRLCDFAVIVSCLPRSRQFGGRLPVSEPLQATMGPRRLTSKSPIRNQFEFGTYKRTGYLGARSTPFVLVRCWISLAKHWRGVAHSSTHQALASRARSLNTASDT